MKWFSTIQTSPSFEKAFHLACQDIHAQLGAEQADLAFVFVSSDYRAAVIDLWPRLSQDLPARIVLGCSGGGVIGAGKEIEEEPAVSITVGVLPGVQISPFHFLQENLPDADASPRAWRELLKTTPEAQPDFLILSDPFSFDTDALVAGLDFAFPHATKAGGLASGGRGPHENLLLYGERILSKGAIGAAISGDIAVEVIVAQGCRPIGEPMTVTGADDNILVSVNNQAPLLYLQELFEKLNPRDQELLQNSLFLGLLMDPLNPTPKQGNFLIRNIIGVDQANGFLGIGAPLRVGQTVQFHLRDAATSRDDLKLMMTRSGSVSLKEALLQKPARAGAVLFSCLGRGKRLYGQANHDSQIVKSYVGDIPIGGFFCNGEIGPVGGKTYLHGYTSSIAVFSPKTTLPH
jgi:small ligand-binding sensory domain FIST